MAARKDSSELLKDSPGISKRQKPDPPVTVVLRDLMSDEGHPLELTSRLNPMMARAAQIGLIFGTMLKCPVTGEVGSSYVRSRIEQIERLGVSMNGAGRQDLIAALQAGGSLPDAYYVQPRTNFEVRE